MIVPARWLLLLLLGAATCAAEFARSSHFLNTVLGSKHTAQLGLSIDDMDAMLEEARAQSSDGLQRTYIACSTLTDSAEAGEAVAAHVGQDNKQTIYSSRSRNMACWAIRATAAEARALTENKVMQSVTVLPDEAKIHGNVVEYFEQQVQGKVAAGKGWTRPAPKAEEAVLKIEFGLGTEKGMQGIDMLGAFASWRGEGVASQAASEQHELNARGRWKGVQQQVVHRQQALRDGGKARCDLSRLRVDSRGYTLEVRGLATLASSAQGMNCLRRLVEAAASDHRVVRVLVAPEYKLMNDHARGITQSGTVGEEPFGAAGLNGAGQIVGVADSGLDDLSCFFIDDDGEKTTRSSVNSPQTDTERRKVIQYIKYADARDDEAGHGTHVCGSIAGKSISGTNNKYNGMAPEAKIAFFDIGVTGKPYLNVPSLYDHVFPVAYDAGARLHSNSWGSSYQACDSQCYEIDRFTHENPEFAVLFAASNDGDNGYFSIGNPAISKNCITVGATEVDSTGTLNNDHLAFFSSIGPTFDNRIKPDVVAPGFYIYSARSSADGNTETCNELSMAGTSMATPVTTGNAALIRQYFENDNFWEANCNSAYANCEAFKPSGALVKAMLINSAQGISKYDDDNQNTVLSTQDLGPPPDYFQGYGRVLLKNTLSFSGINDFDLFVLDGYDVASDSTIALTVTVTDTTEPLRVTMSWYDPPTTGYTSKQVLHDLDLLVVAPDGTTTYWGNGVEYGDEYNNNEKVFIATPVAGTYTVKVHAYPLVEGSSQNISLVITSGGSVTGPATDADWDFDQSQRECGDTELILNFIDFYGDPWGLGKFLAISDDDSGEIVYLGFGAKSLTQTSACLKKDACYTVQLSMAELMGDYSEMESLEVLAEISSCTYLLYNNVEEYSFCLDAAGACDYCVGDFEMNVEWKGTVNNNRKHKTLWLVYDVNAAGKVVGERYGATAVSTAPRKICLDDGLYAIHYADGPKSVQLHFDACDVTLDRETAACVEVKDGKCTFSDVCEDVTNPDSAPTAARVGVFGLVVAVLSALFLANGPRN